jgi:hypothetical protein
MTEMNDLAGQHEVIAENLSEKVIKEVNLLAKEFKDDRKKVTDRAYEIGRLIGSLK